MNRAPTRTGPPPEPGCRLLSYLPVTGHRLPVTGRLFSGPWPWRSRSGRGSPRLAAAPAGHGPVAVRGRPR